jgi:ribonuclease Z
VVWVDLLDEGHSVLLDAGDLRAIPNRKLLRVDRVVVTHTHMDHFIGFDHLLRLVLARERELVVTGPVGFIDNVQGKIDAYTWNVIESYPVRLIAEEVDGATVRSVCYCGAGLRMGLQPGPWLSRLKDAVRKRQPDDTPIEADGANGTTRSFGSAELAAEILFRTPGQKIAYLTDFGGSASNIERATALARDADLLICEAAFLHEDAALAAERYHLTARQSGELARAAGAQRLAPFHFSPRYGGREEELFDEAAAAFGGPILRLPPGPS